MKHFSRLSVFCLSLFILPQMVLAQTNSLKAILDDYTYSMSVEWDQTDRVYAQTQNDLFQSEISKLVEKGLDQDDVKEAFPGVDTEGLEAELQLVDLTNPVAVANFISMKRATSYASGASWGGRVPKAVYVAVIGAAILTLAIILMNHKAKGSTCAEYNNTCEKKCETQSSLFTGEKWVVCYDYCDTSCKYYK